MILDILVPRSGGLRLHHICPKSALVGSLAADLYSIDFEGNVYSSDDLNSYADRLVHAAGRHRIRYPTVARLHLPPQVVTEETMVVGSYDATRLVVVDITDVDALVTWAGEPVEAIAGIRLPTGEIEWPEFLAAAKGLRVWSNGTEHLCTTLCGQFVWGDALRQVGRVFDHDDQKLLALVESRFPRAGISYRLGTRS